MHAHIFTLKNPRIAMAAAVAAGVPPHPLTNLRAAIQDYKAVLRQHIETLCTRLRGGDGSQPWRLIHSRLRNADRQLDAMLVVMDTAKDLSPMTIVLFRGQFNAIKASFQMPA